MGAHERLLTSHNGLADQATVYVVMIVNGLWMMVYLVLAATECIPLSHLWQPSTPAHCLNEVAVVGATAAVGLLLEIIIWILPIPMVWSLQMPKFNKIALTGVFALGLVDIAIGVARVISVIQIDLDDPTWSEVEAIEWILIEPSVAITCISLPICRPLLQKLFPARLTHAFETWRSGYIRQTGRARPQQTTHTDIELGSTVSEANLYQTSHVRSASSKDPWPLDSLPGLG